MKYIMFNTAEIHNCHFLHIEFDSNPPYKKFLHIWTDDQCPHLTRFDVGTLESCKTQCNKFHGCNTINFSARQKDCVLRGCPHPAPKPTYAWRDYYGYTNAY